MATVSKNPMEMTTPQIIAYLNSGKYIPSSIRKLLEEKVEEDRKVNKLKGLDEFFALVAPKTMNKQDMPKEIKEEYPELVKYNSSAPKNNVSFSYASIVNNQFDALKKFKKPLFVGDYLVLDYSDIEKMYQDFAIYRLRMAYLLCNRKIKLIEELEMANANIIHNLKKEIKKLESSEPNIIVNEPDIQTLISQKLKMMKELEHLNQNKINTLKEELDYDNLIIQEQKLKKCHNAYTKLANFYSVFNMHDGLLAILNKAINLLNHGYANKKNFIKPEIEELESYFQKFADLEEELYGSLFQYRNVVKEGKELFQKVVESIQTYDLETLNKESVSASQFIDKLEKSIYQLVEEHDNHLPCEYYVRLQSSNDEPIILLGLSTSFYLSCDEDFALTMEKYFLNPNLLIHLSVDNILQTLNKPFKKKDCYFIHMYRTSSLPSELRINFYFEEKLPKPMVTVKINHLPKDHKYLSCIIGTCQTDTKPVLFKAPILRPYRYWLHKKSENCLYQLDEDDYHKLDSYWQDNYTLDDTRRYIFAIEYLFNDLLENDENSILISPNMDKSFRKLAYQTSNHNTEMT